MYGKMGCMSHLQHWPFGPYDDSIGPQVNKETNVFDIDVSLYIQKRIFLFLRNCPRPPDMQLLSLFNFHQLNLLYKQRKNLKDHLYMKLPLLIFFCICVD